LSTHSSSRKKVGLLSVNIEGHKRVRRSALLLLRLAMREDADLVVKADLRFYFLSLDPANTKIQNKIPKKDPKNRNRACIIHGATYKRVNTVFIGVRSRGRGAVAPPPIAARSPGF